MNRKLFTLIALLAFILLLPTTTLVAQDINPQDVLSGSFLQGTWYEQWQQAGPIYCPNNAQRSMSTLSEAFTLSAPAGESVLTINYSQSRSSRTLVRGSNGMYFATEDRGWYIHLVEVTRISPTQMSVVSNFVAKDGSCTLTNRATWSFTGTPQQPPPTSGCTLFTASVTVNKRSGPGLTYTVVGQIVPGQSASVIGTSFDIQGRRWWQLADNTWVSSVVTTVSGNCPA